jgi:quercetin dioxygenase-like cupin family protein
LASTHALEFFRDQLAPGANLSLPDPCPRVLYVRSGSLTARSNGIVATLAPDSAWHGESSCEVTAGKSGAEIYRWKLRREAGTSGATSALCEALTLDPKRTYLMRCDRVDFPPAGIAYTHTHQGPGIRCLLSGAIRIRVSGAEHLVRPGEAWFEAGPDPVLALASEREPTAFARVMILPAELRGKSSIRYVLPEDADKPKRQTYQLFVDDLIVC